jgi:hypothetical protein
MALDMIDLEPMTSIFQNGQRYCCSFSSEQECLSDLVKAVKDEPVERDN